MTEDELKASLTQEQADALYDLRRHSDKQEAAWARVQYGVRFIEWANARGIEISGADAKAVLTADNDGAELLETLRKVAGAWSAK